MAATSSLMPFLRPLSLPQPSTVRQFLRYASTIPTRRPGLLDFSQPANRKGIPPLNRRAVQPHADRNVAASRHASPSYPPPSMPSNPRPKVSRASRRTAKPGRLLPTYREKPRPPLNPPPVTFLPEEESAPNLKYFVTRTRNQELPVYQHSKRGGNLHITLVKKIDGSINMLKDLLKTELKLGGKDVVVNERTRQIVIKGHYKQEVDLYLRERRF